MRGLRIPFRLAALELLGPAQPRRGTVTIPAQGLGRSHPVWLSRQAWRSLVVPPAPTRTAESAFEVRLSALASRQRDWCLPAARSVFSLICQDLLSARPSTRFVVDWSAGHRTAAVQARSGNPTARLHRRLGYPWLVYPLRWVLWRPAWKWMAAEANRP